MSTVTYRDAGASVDEPVADLLGRMTLEEKVHDSEMTSSRVARTR